jgi:CRP/FNR family transcriptional regulator
MEVASTVELLRRLPLFADMAAGELLPLAGQTRLDQYEPEETVFYQGDASDRVWLIRRGRLKIVHQGPDGRETILEVLGAGDVFGGATLFMPRHPATAAALEPLETVSFSSEAYSEYLYHHPAVALKLIRMLGSRLHSLMALQVLAGERVERRMAHILLKLADRSGRNEPEGRLIPIPLSRQDLADMAGTTLETAIRTISRFNKEQLVKTRRGGYLVILDVPRLRELAGQD